MKKTKNKEETKNKIIVILISIIILLTLVLICVVSIKKFNNKDTNINNEIINNNSNTNKNNNNNNNTVNEDTNNKNIITDLSVYGEPNYSVSTEEKNTDYTFKIQQDNSIIINNKNNITNITNAKNIKLFSPPAPYSILYILTEDGNIYKYETSNYESNNYKATKIDTYNNIKEIITYQKRTTEGKGGCDYIIIKDNNDNYYELDSFCV